MITRFFTIMLLMPAASIILAIPANSDKSYYYGEGAPEVHTTLDERVIGKVGEDYNYDEIAFQAMACRVLG